MNTLQNINESWKWKNIEAVEIIQTNDFGNVIFKNSEEEYWRICPEEVSCEKLAGNKLEFENLVGQTEFIKDWEMKNLVEMAKSKLGKLSANQSYCLKMPAPIGGKYEESNLGKIDFSELLSFSGDLARQIENLKDGDEIRFEIKN
ncbi:T6SS immunity protein Tdi1 domain-containing protein [Flavobacterium wongokense]|uniref:T6SS immunity protein Tdi1 domain-containing protein n=1 Tax=Flavobacterium wongokense TaxID=2910674 RepID=UPI001F265C2E|nr:T6SS immunity protein Tdi1 domain-containing protein [Flavobacterium sp. WG47]MCF6133465.1 DUF1851 domain-containing protein [Flavobacterium sp. WG47]